jgi:predicted helicase
MRKYLQQDFTQIYHLDLHGNVRKNPKLSGTTHNVFGIQVGVGITIAVRNSQNPERSLYYYRVPEQWRRIEKLAFLEKKRSISGVDWRVIQPDKRYTWITDGLMPEFTSFMPLGNKNAKLMREIEENSLEVKTIFKQYTLGVQTNRDDWVYDFNRETLEQKIKNLIDTYNGEIDRWRRGGEPKDIDDFVIYNDTKIKWSRDLKSDLKRKRYAQFQRDKIRDSLYRPYTKKHYFFDSILSQDIFQQPKFFPTFGSEAENIVICVPGLGNRKEFGCLAANAIPSMDLAFEKAQSFPYYTYSPDGTNRRENITDWALAQFQKEHGPEVTKWDIFHYVYSILHHPQYRERYKENLKRDLPHIPLVTQRGGGGQSFRACVAIGRQLMDLHLNYEQAKDTLEKFENEGVPFSWRVEKMRLSSDRRVVVVNESLRLGPIPPEAFEYRLGNRSALEWVIDQYQVTTDKRSGIVSDPNGWNDDEEYIIRLVGKVVTVSVETVRLVKELEQAVKVEDWLGEEAGKL